MQRIFCSLQITKKQNKTWPAKLKLLETNKNYIIEDEINPFFRAGTFCVLQLCMWNR